MTMTTKTDTAEAAAWRVFCEMSKYRSANKALSRLPDYGQRLLNAHAAWAELFAR